MRALRSCFHFRHFRQPPFTNRNSRSECIQWCVGARIISRKRRGEYDSEC
jgi:hypothetical protein